MDLTTLDAVRAQLGISSTVDDALLRLYVTQASRAIETYCGRRFSDVVGTLHYDLRSTNAGGRVRGNVLYFSTDVLKVDSLYNGGTLVPNTDYRLLPSDNPLLYSTHWARYALELLPSAGRHWQVNANGNWQEAISVVGTFGYCLARDRPPDIVLAATKLAAWLYQNRDNTGAAVQMADGSVSMPAELPQFALKMLSRYVRVEAYF